MSIDTEELIEWLRQRLDSDLVVVDVGARWGVADRWRPFGPRVKVIGFDPDEAECARLEHAEGGDGGVSFVPAALLDDVSSADATVPDTQYFDSRPVPLAGQGGQLFWAHAYFVRADLAMPDATRLGWSRALRAACAASAFGFVDLAASLLGRADDAPCAHRSDLARLRSKR